MAPDDQLGSATAPESAPRPLSVEEAEALGAPQSQRGRAAPMSLAGRLVSDLTVSGIDWADSWENAVIERTRFRGCAFSGHELGQARYRGVTFEDCTFEGCGYVHGIFEGCRFADCTFMAGSTSMVTLRDCSFVDSALSRVVFRDVRFDGVVFEGGSLAHVRFAECKCHYLELDSTALDAVRFTRCETGRLRLSDCVARRLMLLGGTWGVIEVERGQFSDLGLVEASVRELRMSDVRRVARYGIGRARVSEISVARCAISGMYWSESELSRLMITGGTYEGWLTQCGVGAGSTITDAELASFFWDQTTIRGITLSHVSFANFICARDALFANLRLIDVTYAPELRLVLDGTQFDGSDRFGSAAEGRR